MLACMNVATGLWKGDGVKRDLARAGDLMQKSCDAGVRPACFNLAAMYSAGEGVTKDKTRALKLYQRLCAEGNSIACDMVKEKEKQ